MQQQPSVEENGNPWVYSDCDNKNHQVPSLDRALDKDCQGKTGGTTEVKKLSASC